MKSMRDMINLMEGVMAVPGIGKKPEPRFKDVSCSQCGRSFGPGDHGYSHCRNHKGKLPTDEQLELGEKSSSEKQARFMAAAAHDPSFAKNAGISQGVAKDFNKADTGTKQLSQAMKNKECSMTTMEEPESPAQVVSCNQDNPEYASKACAMKEDIGSSHLEAEAAFKKFEEMVQNSFVEPERAYDMIVRDMSPEIMKEFDHMLEQYGFAEVEAGENFFKKMNPDDHEEDRMGLGYEHDDSPPSYSGMEEADPGMEDPELEHTKKIAKENSKEGYVQHVNYDQEGDRYYISDWYDSDETIASYENGRNLDQTQMDEEPEGYQDEQGGIPMQSKNGVIIHDLRGMDGEEAYGVTQTDDDFKDGDLMLVDGGIAVMMRAWPVMMVGDFPGFHILNSDVSWDSVEGGKYSKPFQVAQSLGDGIEEAFDLENGYDDVHYVDGKDYFPSGADSPVMRDIGGNAKQGDNPEQKRVKVAEVHKELVYKYRNYLKESSIQKKKLNESRFSDLSIKELYDGVYETHGDLAYDAPINVAGKALDAKNQPVLVSFTVDIKAQAEIDWEEDETPTGWSHSTDSPIYTSRAVASPGQIQILMVKLSSEPEFQINNQEVSPQEAEYQLGVDTIKQLLNPKAYSRLLEPSFEKAAQNMVPEEQSDERDDYDR